MSAGVPSGASVIHVDSLVVSRIIPLLPDRASFLYLGIGSRVQGDLLFLVVFGFTLRFIVPPTIGEVCP